MVERSRVEKMVRDTREMRVVRYINSEDPVYLDVVYIRVEVEDDDGFEWVEYRINVTDREEEIAEWDS